MHVLYTPFEGYFLSSALNISGCLMIFFLILGSIGCGSLMGLGYEKQWKEGTHMERTAGWRSVR